MKLQFENNEYYLMKDGEDLAIATTDESFIKELGAERLSRGNCEAIKNGYDLDELALLELPVVDDLLEPFQKLRREQWVKGFQKALEILGDKKFWINEVVELSKILISNPIERCGKTPQELVDAYVKSLQQTEWDVEIDMICPHPIDTYRCGLQYGCDGDGCNHPNQIPYLDKEGCLILKSK